MPTAEGRVANSPVILQEFAIFRVPKSVRNAASSPSSVCFTYPGAIWEASR